MRQIALSTITPMLCLVANSLLLAQGTWTPLTNPIPTEIGQQSILLTDGTVLVAGSAGFGPLSRQWSKLTPDTSGNYVNGTWSLIAPMKQTRKYFGSCVLPSGKLFVIGGEYSSDGTNPGPENLSNSGEIYDPVANTWTTIATFPQQFFGDDPTKLMNNGKILCGYIFSPQTYLYDPVANTWTITGNKLDADRSDEEGFTLLADGSVVSYNIFASPDVGAGTAQRYSPLTGQWVTTGPVPVPLSSASLGFELGPAILLPDGRVFQIGANNNTVLYIPSTNTWVQGPSLPVNFGCDDAPAALLPNGQVIFIADNSVPTIFTNPSKVFLFDPVANAITDITPGGALGEVLSLAPAFGFTFMVLPNGHVLLTGDYTGTVWDYAPAGTPNAAWLPTISSVQQSSSLNYTLKGAQINGLSEASAYGDDGQNSTNYPIVRLKSEAGKTIYCKTSNWAPGVVASGTRQLSTNFTLPSQLSNGVYEISVIANGIASASQPFIIGPPIVSSTVIATFTPATKTLVLQGDANANTVTVTYQAGVLKVEGANGTSIGVIGASKKLTVAPSQSFTVSGAISLTSTLGTGNDSIALVGVDATTVTLNFGTGMDNAALTLCSVGTLNVTGYHTGDTLITTSSTITHKPKLP